MTHRRSSLPSAGFIALACASLVLGACALKLREPTQHQRDRVHDSDAPATMKDQQGKAWHVNDVYRSGPSVVIFYRGHWCGFCKRQLAELSKEHAKFESLGVRLIAISADPDSENRAFAQKIGAPFALISDPKLEAITSFGVLEAEHDLAVPAVFVLNKDGQTVWREVGESIQSTVKAKKLLKVLSDLKASGELQS